MMGLKKNQKPKFSRGKVENNLRELQCPDHPVFCFKYLTTNKQFCLKYFDKDKERMVMCDNLVRKLLEFAGNSWREVLQRSKKNGVETLPYDQLNFRVNNDYPYEISTDTKIMVLRFFQQNGRILGIKREKCPIIHIIGFDFNYSAYNH